MGVKHYIIDNIGVGGGRQELPEDIAREISDLILSSLPDSHNGEYTGEQLNEIMDFQRVLTPEQIIGLAENGYLVYSANGYSQLIGCGIVSERCGKYELKNLHVRKDYQGNGIGSAILKLCEDKLRQIGQSAAFVDAFNLQNTLTFYKSRGFKEFGEHPHPELFIPMAKSLKN